jgi:2'-5' RNA ligase
MPAHNLHVTLVFLGSVADRRIPELEAIADRVAAASCSNAEAAALGSAASRMVVSSATGADAQLGPPLVFDRIQHWKKPRVLTATAGAPSAAASALAEALRANLTTAGFTPDLKPFRAHVTLARKVLRPVSTMDIEPVVWSFTDFALVESRTEPEGAVYTVLQTFPLGVRRSPAP